MCIRDRQYSGDQYIKIYNNSDSVLYADGLVILESAFNTAQQYEYTPDIMSQAMAVQCVYVIPGNGKDYPVCLLYTSIPTNGDAIPQKSAPKPSLLAMDSYYPTL